MRIINKSSLAEAKKIFSIHRLPGSVYRVYTDSYTYDNIMRQITVFMPELDLNQALNEPLTMNYFGSHIIKFSHTHTKEYPHTCPQQAASDIDKATKHPPKCVNFKVSTLEFRFSLVFPRFFSLSLSVIFAAQTSAAFFGKSVNAI